MSESEEDIYDLLDELADKSSEDEEEEEDILAGIDITHYESEEDEVEEEPEIESLEMEALDEEESEEPVIQEEEEYIMMPAFKDIERVQVGSLDLATNLYLRKKGLLTPKEQFILLLDKALSESTITKEINKSQLQILNTHLEKDSIPRVEYKNPTALIYGLFILDRKKVSIDLFNKYKKDIHKQNISTYDLLRYGRFWENVLS